MYRQNVYFSLIYSFKLFIMINKNRIILICAQSVNSTAYFLYCGHDNTEHPGRSLLYLITFVCSQLWLPRWNQIPQSSASLLRSTSSDGSRNSTAVLTGIKPQIRASGRAKNDIYWNLPIKASTYIYQLERCKIPYFKLRIDSLF